MHLLPKVAPQALLLADNALSHADELTDDLDAVSRLQQFEHRVLPVGKG